MLLTCCCFMLTSNLVSICVIVLKYKMTQALWLPALILIDKTICSIINKLEKIKKELLWHLPLALDLWVNIPLCGQASVGIFSANNALNSDTSINPADRESCQSTHWLQENVQHLTSSSTQQGPVSTLCHPSVLVTHVTATLVLT